LGLSGESAKRVTASYGRGGACQQGDTGFVLRFKDLTSKAASGLAHSPAQVVLPVT